MAGEPSHSATHWYKYLVTGDMEGFFRAVPETQVGDLRYPKDESNVLHIIASFGHVDLLDSFLPQWPNLLFMQNSKGDFALHSALKAGKINAAKYLIELLGQQDKSNVILVCGEGNMDGNTALHIALDNYEQELAKDLVKLYPQALYVMNLKGICPLHLAIKLEMMNVIELMLTNLKDFKENANRNLRKGKSIFQAVISSRKTEILQYILDVDPELMNMKDEEGKTALSYAAYMGDVEKARLLFEKIPNSAFIYDEDGTYPIHQAVLGAHTNIIKLLTSSMFLVNAKGQNIIHLATLTGKPNLVFYILNMPEVDSLINQKDDDGNTPLHLATIAKDVELEVIELLLQDVRVKVEALNKVNITAYDLAEKLTLNNQDISVVQRLNFILNRAKNGLKCASIEGVFLRLLLQGDEYDICELLFRKRIQLKDLACLESGSNILHIAATMDPMSVDLVIKLLDDQFDIFMEQPNNSGDLPIHSATKAGQLWSLSTLLEKKTNIPKDRICVWPNRKGNTPLHIAVLNNQLRIANYLYGQCAKATYTLNMDNICPLFLAIKCWSKSDLVINMINELDRKTIQDHLKGAKSVIHAAILSRNTEILKKLVEKAPSLLWDSHDSKGRSPLSYAAHIGHFEGVKFILQRFPNLEFIRDKDKDGSFPIHQAVKGGQLKILKLLHPEYCLVNNKYQNILHIAAETDAYVVKYLLKRKEFKVLIDTGDEDGNTPLHLAVKALSYDVVYCLTFENHVDGNALNNELLTPRDMLDEKNLSPLQIETMEMMLRRVEGAKSCLSVSRMEEKEKEKADVVASEKEQKARRMERANTYLVVAVLIITVTFTAAFTPPGGYSDTGIPVLYHTVVYKFYIWVNFFAFFSALVSAATFVLGVAVPELAEGTVLQGGTSINAAIMFMLVAFAIGSFAPDMLDLSADDDDDDLTFLLVQIIMCMFTISLKPAMFYLSFLCRKCTRLGLSYLSRSYLLILLEMMPKKITHIDFTI